MTRADSPGNIIDMEPTFSVQKFELMLAVVLKALHLLRFTFGPLRSPLNYYLIRELGSGIF